MLTNHRKQIDEIDSQIISLLSQRLNLSKEIANIKNLNKLKIKDKTRERELLTQLTKKAKQTNLREKYIKRIFKVILGESRKIQKNGKHKI